MEGQQANSIQVMPYSMLVGQTQLKRALELAHVAPRIGGVLLSGERGTGKSTVVRAFASMMYGRLPVTLPINATEDRVVGGWQIDALLQGRKEPQQGLLAAAHGSVLYIDEVNLLDDHIVNIILDVTSTGILVVQREGKDEESAVDFTLVGTMNPSEGGLRPQLLDRFGLMVDVVAESSPDVRTAILEAVLDYDAARGMERAGMQGRAVDRLRERRVADDARREELRQARERFPGVELDPSVARVCVDLADAFKAEGHRGDYVLAMAARANAALRGGAAATREDLVEVAALALQHRRAGGPRWTAEDAVRVTELIHGAAVAPEAAGAS